MFASTFWRNLKSPEIQKLLDRHFFIIGWNIEDSKYHGALNTALTKHSLYSVTNLIESKCAAALCIVPTEDSFRIYSCIRGKSSDEDFLLTLQNAEEFFNDINPDLQLQGETQQTDVKMNSREIQQLMAEMFANRDYNSFEYDEHKYLIKDIAYALKGAPETQEGYDKCVQSVAEELYKKILENNSK